MNREELDLLLGTMPEERLLFPYFKDRYALMLLAWASEGGIRVADLKQSGLASLLTRPAVRSVLAGVGDGVVHPEHFEAWWPRDWLVYELSFGRWRAIQTTCRDHNLVLQVNFVSREDRQLARLVPEDVSKGFRYRGHPIHPTRNTLAWVRIDVDLQRGAALIEEVQTDWIRCAKALLDQADPAQERYRRTVLEPHARIWDEASLAASLWFLREHLGIRDVWFHTHEGGTRAKRIGGRTPPRSLYTTLPRRFGFRETDRQPELVGRRAAIRKRLRGIRFQRASL